MMAQTMLAAPVLSPGPINIIINLIAFGPVVVPVPIPEIGFALPETIPDAIFNVLMNGGAAVTIIGICPITPLSGPCGPGPVAGICSGMLVGPARAILGSFNVLVAGTPLVLCGDPWLENLINCPGFCPVSSAVNIQVN